MTVQKLSKPTKFHVISESYNPLTFELTTSYCNHETTGNNFKTTINPEYNKLYDLSNESTANTSTTYGFPNFGQRGKV